MGDGDQGQSCVGTTGKMEGTTPGGPGGERAKERVVRGWAVVGVVLVWVVVVRERCR